jgi:Skp family chaperone for outer membrane proteins
MERPRSLSRLIVLVMVSGVVLAGIGCAGFPESELVRRFFQASQYRDTATLGNIATVSFDAQEDGIAMSPKVVAVSPEQARPLEMRRFAAELREATEADEAFSKRKKEYQDKNLDAIERVLKAEAKGAKVTGRDAQVQAEWTKWRQETADFAKRVSDARKRLNDERAVAQLSHPDLDVATYDGTEYTKEVTVEATVKKGNETAKKTIILTFQRAILKDESGKEIVGKWMITKLSQQ